MDAATALDLLAQMDADNVPVPCFSESDLSTSEYSNNSDVPWELSAGCEDDIDDDEDEDVHGGCDPGSEDAMMMTMEIPVATMTMLALASMASE